MRAPTHIGTERGYTQETVVTDVPNIRYVRCRGCLARIAVTQSVATTGTSQRSSIYCNVWCQMEPRAVPQQARNDLWRLLHNVYDLSGHEIATLWETTHPQVYAAFKYR